MREYEKRGCPFRIHKPKIPPPFNELIGEYGADLFARVVCSIRITSWNKMLPDERKIEIEEAKVKYDKASKSEGSNLVQKMGRIRYNRFYFEHCVPAGSRPKTSRQTPPKKPPETTNPKSKKQPKSNDDKPAKPSIHRLRLQRMPAEQASRVIDKILKGEIEVISDSL